MALRKFAADYLFTGHELLDRNAVLVTDETGKVIGLSSTSNFADGIERYNGILCPGFVNVHCHLELSNLRGAIPKGIGMIDFLLSVMRKRNFPVAKDVIASEIAYMRRTGTVAVGDVCNTADTLDAKSSSDVYFHNFIEALGVAPAAAQSRFDVAKEVYSKFKTEFETNSIVPHAPYSVSAGLFNLIHHFDPTGILCIHNQESEAEISFMKSGTGDLLRLFRQLGLDYAENNNGTSSGVQFLINHIPPTHPIILVHNCYTTNADLDHAEAELAKGAELWWCVCPNANIYIGNKLPDPALLKRMSASIVVGTDSLASNTQLNILDELKTLQQSFNWLNTEQLLTWATFNGARALQINGRYGSFEKGKRPGVVIIHGGKGLSLEGTVSRRVL